MRVSQSVVVAVMVLGIVVSAAQAEREGGERFRFSVDLLAEYTDNRDALPDLIKEETWDFTIRPRIDIYADTERALFDLYYAPSFRYRTEPRPGQDDTLIGHDVGLNAHVNASRRLALRVLEKFVYRDEPSVDDTSGFVLSDRDYLLNKTEVGATAALGKRTDADIFGRYAFKSFQSDAVARVGDEDRLDVGAALLQEVGKTLDVGLQGGLSMFGYDSASGVQRDFDVYYGGVSVENQFSKHLRGGIVGGVQQATYDDAAIGDSTVPFAEVWLKGATTPSLKLRGAVKHGVRDADAFPFASQEYTEVRGRIKWDATAKASVTLRGKYVHGEYDDVLPSAAVLASLIGLPSGSEDTLDASAQLAYDITDNTTVRLRQRYEEVDSDVRVSFEKNTSTIELTTNF